MLNLVHIFVHMECIMAFTSMSGMVERVIKHYHTRESW